MAVDVLVASLVWVLGMSERDPGAGVSAVVYGHGTLRGVMGNAIRRIRYAVPGIRPGIP